VPPVNLLVDISNDAFDIIDNLKKKKNYMNIIKSPPRPKAKFSLTRLAPKFTKELFLGLSFKSYFNLSGITTIRFLNLFSKVELLAKTLLRVKCETGAQP
jgi:hypothetical protein